MLTLVLVVIVAALVFEFINGFHDTANSIATVVATKVLSPGQAVMLAASMNLVGAFAGTAVAKTIASGLVDSFITPIEREDIEALGSALYKIPKQIEKFADRYSLATEHLAHIDFAPRAAMLEQAAQVVVDMVHELRTMNLDRMTALNEKLRAIENEADRLMLELYRDIYSGRLDHLQMFLLKEFFEILEKAIDRCREAGVVAYQIVLKNS